MKKIITKGLKNAVSYVQYRTLVADLLVEHKSTGANQSDDLYNYSRLNNRRMKRLDKTIQLTRTTKNALKKLTQKQTWLVISEGWCGDAAQNLPILNKMASENENINLQIVLRDENLELMDEFLTNGGRSIPKLIAVNKNNEILFTWGPRPSLATKLVTDYKTEHGIVDAKIKEDLQIWYNKNKGVNLQEDIISLLNK